MRRVQFEGVTADQVQVTDYSVRLHQERDLVSFYWEAPTSSTEVGASGSSFQMRTAAVAALLDYMSMPVRWRWSCAVNGWARTSIATLTIGEVQWRWVETPDGANEMQILGNLLDHGYPSADLAGAFALLATLTEGEVAGLRGALAVLIGDGGVRRRAQHSRHRC